MPNEALAAGAWAMRSGGKDAMTTGMLAPLEIMSRDQPKLSAVIAALKPLIAASGGDIVAYLGKGTMLPEFTIALPTTAEAAATFLTVIAEQNDLPQQDELSLFLGAINLRLGYREGRLIATSAAAGIAGFARQGDGFMRRPEIAAADAAGGTASCNARFFVRSEALVDQALPFAQMLGATPEEVQGLTEFRDRSAARKNASFMVLRADEKGAVLEASGAAGIVAIALGIAQMAPNTNG